MEDMQRDIPGAPVAARGIKRVVDFALAEHEADPLRGSWNPSDGYRTILWTFTRAVRSCYAEGADPDVVFFEVHGELEHRDGWEALGTDLTAEDIYFEFVNNWDAVRYKVGETPLANALEKADTCPLLPTRASKHPQFLANYSKFISIAGWLQVTMGDRPILLPVAKLSEALNVRPMTIARYRQSAETDGLLRVVREHAYSKGRATEFRFTVEAFPVLHKHGHKDAGRSFESNS